MDHRIVRSHIFRRQKGAGEMVGHLVIAFYI